MPQKKPKASIRTAGGACNCTARCRGTSSLQKTCCTPRLLTPMSSRLQQRWTAAAHGKGNSIYIANGWPSGKSSTSLAGKARQCTCLWQPERLNKQKLGCNSVYLSSLNEGLINFSWLHRPADCIGRRGMSVDGVQAPRLKIGS